VSVLTGLELIQPAALVVIDLQNDFTHPDGKGAREAGRPIAATRATIPVVRRLLDAAREHGLPVYFFRQTHDPDHDYPEAWKLVRQRVRFSAPQMCVKGTWGHAIVDELTPLPGEAVYDKLSYSGFCGTSLAEDLERDAVQSIVFTGCSTNVCVESTVREAFSRGFLPIVPRDAVSSWSAELHDASLRTLNERFAVVCDAGDVLARWAEG